MYFQFFEKGKLDLGPFTSTWGNSLPTCHPQALFRSWLLKEPCVTIV